jgi:hypothetical protein
MTSWLHDSMGRCSLATRTEPLGRPASRKRRGVGYYYYRGGGGRGPGEGGGRGGWRLKGVPKIFRKFLFSKSSLAL